jgi:hypothetical protein
MNNFLINTTDKKTQYLDNISGVILVSAVCFALSGLKESVDASISFKSNS